MTKTSKTATDKRDGFTTVELLIASAIFSLVLLIALAGFLQIGRLFYKGVAKTDTQDTAQQILNDVSSSLQTAVNVSPNTSGNGYNYYCVGSTRYTFNIDKQIDKSATPNYTNAGKGNFGLVKDTLPGDTACAPPCVQGGTPACSSGFAAFHNPQELLGDRMRLSSFGINQSTVYNSPDLFNVSVMVTYGSNDVIAYKNSSNPSTVYCQGGSGNQFCAISLLNTSTLRGLHL